MYKFADRDIGMDCTFETIGETIEEVKDKAFAHARIAHADLFESLDDEQMAEMEKRVEDAIQKI